MSHHENDEITRDEIKKEFQLERMILFSDAVFAIVITLMAMEIKLPESEIMIDVNTLPRILIRLLPVLFAYSASFVFIGVIWYQHLTMFSIMKDYDKGLVIRNLLLLFFVSLFPFSATVITKTRGSSISIFLYMSVILSCLIAQYFLYHYILVRKPHLRLNTDISEHTNELKKRQISVIGFSFALILISITYYLIPVPELKSLSTLWMLVLSLVYGLIMKRKGKR